MASRYFAKILHSRVFITGTGISAAAITGNQIRRQPTVTPAQAEFSTSSLYSAPAGWTGRVWQIRNDYPPPASSSATPNSPSQPPLPIGSPPVDSPWLNVDFRTNPLMYCAIIKEYCWEGNANNEFVVQNNTVRNWYHAPWMHWGPFGREPLNGLTWERSTPKFELSRTQGRILQSWACGYYNGAGASVFAKVWQDPNNPQWTTDLKFPLGTCVFKILLTDATDAEVPTMAGAPALNAMISADGTPTNRNNFASDIRLLQVDFAVRDDRSSVGWVFGTFMYNGNKTDRDPWDRIIPVGVMWGNDPILNQIRHDLGNQPEETWINPEAEQLRLSLGGGRPSWGWNGRLCGPVDNFISSCISCHSVAQKTEISDITPPEPIHTASGEWVPANDTKTMRWFRNIPSGTPFDAGATSGDYSLQMTDGYRNYQLWYTATQRTALGRFIRKAISVPGKAFGYVVPGSTEPTRSSRQGPDMVYDPPKK